MSPHHMRRNAILTPSQPRPCRSRCQHHALLLCRQLQLHKLNLLQLLYLRELLLHL